ncbi:Uncharacterised protein [Shigella sonnei]|nr:Uncharacterised protein [Shigella sonnei]
MINAQLLLHFRMRQAHFTPYHATPLHNVILHIYVLNGVGRFSVIDTNQIAQRRNRFALLCGAA